ncbi:MAG: CatB-related O-acetyltransferase [Pseudomonadota bacterium]
MAFPDPDTRHPIIMTDGTPHLGSVFLKSEVDHPRINVGDFTYASATYPPENWVERLAPYLFPDSREALIIGKFCQIADSVTFITASANHRHDGFSTYPFAIFEGDRDTNRPSMKVGETPDTILGHDIWLGKNATILPGARIGCGTIVGAGAVVGGEIPDYAVVAGNPGRVIRMRFDDATIVRLLAIAWWHWPISHILKHEAAICGADLSALETAALQLDESGMGA